MAGFWRASGRAVKLVGYFAYAAAELLVRRPATRQDRADWLHRFCARALHGFGITVEIVGGPFPPRGAVISNHLSYLDIVVFAGLHRCVFVSKAEIEGWPVIGWMTTMSGTVYVERGRGESAAKARGGMQAASDAGLPVVFFPEGTTTNGSGLLKFHSGILGQAMCVQEPVTAAFLHYRLREPNAPGVTVADDVCFWGETPMLPHVFRLLGLRGLHADVRFAELPIAFSSDELHRKKAALEAQAAVAALGGFELGPSGAAGGQGEGLAAVMHQK